MSHRPPRYVEPVPPEVLNEASEKGRMDSSSEKLVEAEREYIRRWRDACGRTVPQAADADWRLSGIALSGGGIRSATFALGVLQTLARRDLLRRMDYLSTVSGGGYIGASLVWLTSEAAWSREIDCRNPCLKEPEAPEPCARPSLDPDGFPYGTGESSSESESSPPEATATCGPWQGRLLRYLREHGYYLTPGKGLNVFSMLGVVLRGMLANLAVWLPAITLFFLFGLWGSERLSQCCAPRWMAPQPPALSWAAEAFAPAPGAEEAALETHWAAAWARLLGFELFLEIAGLMFALLSVGGLAFAFTTFFARGTSTQAKCTGYRWRRRAECTIAWAIPIATGLLAIGALPLVGALLHHWRSAAGWGAVIGGAAITVYRFLTDGVRSARPPTGWPIWIAAALFLYGLLLLAYGFAQRGLDELSTEGVWIVLVAGGAWVLLAGVLVNLNYIAIHRFYRDRLMEAFMPDPARALADLEGMAAGADATPLHELVPAACPGPDGTARNQTPARCPYPLLNTNVVLVDSERRTYRRRGGDNFVLSPLYCGSNATGWRSTKGFMGGKMTLPTAVAISGAAINPNTGVGGEGVMRNRLLSLVLSLLNLRLGYWANHPRPGWGCWASPQRPNHFIPGVYALASALGFGRFGHTERRAFLELSDGGHFENMAVYELIRRRLRLILLCDGAADPEFSFSDFQNTARRVEEDFGARIVPCQDATPDDMMPVPSEGKYPPGRAFAKRGYMVCIVHYSDGSHGVLIYLKTALIESVRFAVKGYAAKNPDFPDQTTVDQFFDEVQFEAYRALGQAVAEQMLQAPPPQACSRALGGATPPATLEAFIRGQTA